MKREVENNLDHLFKDGLNEPGQHMEYREGDWLALENMLNADKKRGIIAWLPFITGVAAILLLVSAWLLFSTANKTGKQQVVQQATKQLGRNLDKQVATNVRERTPAAHIITNKVTDIPAPQHLLVTGLATPIHNIRANIKSRQKSPASYTGSKTIPNIMQGEPINEPLLAVSLQNTDGLFISDEFTIRTLDIKTSEHIQPETNVNTPVLALRKAYRPQFAITVLAANNVNGVSTFKQGKVGIDAGLLLSVQVSKKFAFSTGVIYAKKPYMANAENYLVASGYGSKLYARDVTADCRVLDIPLNVDYRFYSKNKNTLSVGTGLSSYLMLSENYHYNYTNAYAQGPPDYNVANQNQHFLGVLNLSTTYQRQLNSKLSIGLQPYLKIPLTNIGYGKVKLQTAGVSVGLSWNLNSLYKP